MSKTDNNQKKWTPAQQSAFSLKGGTFLISAAAGSGKTATLTERIIKSIIDDERDISRLLVVTFTNAAADELKERITKRLTDALKEQPDNTHLMAQLRNIGNAPIRTIDAFYTEPVKSHFAELGISPSIRIVEKAEVAPIKQQVIAETMDSFYFKYANNSDNPATENMFSAMLDDISPAKENEQTITVLEKIYDTLSRNPTDLKTITKTAQKLNQQSDFSDFWDTDYGLVIKNNLNILLDSAIKSLTELVQNLYSFYGQDKNLSKGFSVIEGDITTYTAIKGKLSSSSFFDFTSYLDTVTFAKWSVSKDLPHKDEIKSVRDYFKQELVGYKEMYCSLTRADLQETMKRTATLALILADWLNTFDQAYRKAKTEKNICEFSDMRTFMYRLLYNEDETPTAFADQIYKQYDEVYIDEYQDVDRTQDRIFEIIGRDHRFMVGDIKQCIYAFRGSNPEIFSQYRDNFIKIDSTIAQDEQQKQIKSGENYVIYMSENFRCNTPIIHFTNMLCGKIFNASHSITYQAETDNLKHGKTETSHENHPVQIALFDKNQAKGENEDFVLQEDQWVAHEIARLLSPESKEKKDDGTPIEPKDIVILARNKKSLQAITNELKCLCLPYINEDSSAKDDVFKNDITLFSNILHVIDNPLCDTCLLDVLLRIFNFNHEDILLIRNQSDDSDLFNSIRYFTKQARKNTKKQNLVFSLCSTFLEWYQQWHRYSLTVGADTFVKKMFQSPLFSSFAEHDAYIFLYDLARQYCHTGKRDLYGFITFLDQTFESESSYSLSNPQNAISLMTVHKAKGLERPICFLVHMDKNGSSNKTPSFVYFLGKMLGSKLTDPNDIFSASHIDTIMHQTTQLCLAQNETEEMMRLLYVAMTRAQERLYLTATYSSLYSAKLKTKAAYLSDSSYFYFETKNWLLWLLAGIVNPNTIDYFQKNDIFVVMENPIPFDIATFEHQTENCTTQKSSHADSYTDSFIECINSSENDYTPSYDDDVHIIRTALRNLPTKLAASSITSHWLDTWIDLQLHPVSFFNNAHMQDAQAALYKQMNDESLLSFTDSQPSATEFGTAIHAFLQYCDWNHIASGGAQEELDRLNEAYFLTERQCSMLQKQISLFEKSPLLDLITKADKIERELRFSTLIPVNKLTQDPTLRQEVAGMAMFVQGSIDLLIHNFDGHMILIDYKTDKKRPKETEEMFENRLRENHMSQLSVYRDVLYEMYDVYPKETFIYSLTQNKLIPIVFL